MALTPIQGFLSVRKAYAPDQWTQVVAVEPAPTQAGSVDVQLDGSGSQRQVVIRLNGCAGAGAGSPGDDAMATAPKRHSHRNQG